MSNRRCGQADRLEDCEDDKNQFASLHLCTGLLASNMSHDTARIHSLMKIYAMPIIIIRFYKSRLTF